MVRTRASARLAVLAELAAHGYGGITMERVAHSSGIAKSTLYRHWSDVHELLADALDHGSRQPDVEAAVGSARDAVTRLLAHLAEAMEDDLTSGVLPAMVGAAEHDSRIAVVHHRNSARRRARLCTAIEQGVASGEFPAETDAELSAWSLSGAIIARRLLDGTVFPPTEVPRLIDAVLGPAG